MNSKVELKFNDKCACTTTISLRNIMEIGMKSVIENIATITTTSLTNKELFGNYKVDYLFVLGDPFNLSHGSQIYNAYSLITQQVIGDDIHLKERNILPFVLRESIFTLLESVKSQKPYMYERFVTGTLCQVSNQTYAVRFPSIYTGKFYSFSRINHKNHIKNTIHNDGQYLAFIQKGKPIPTTELMIKMAIDSVDRPWTGKCFFYM